MEQGDDVAMASSSPPEHDAWHAAIEYGIDVSLVERRLAMTPLERLQANDRAAELVRLVRESGMRQYAFERRSAGAIKRSES